MMTLVGSSMRVGCQVRKEALVKIDSANPPSLIETKQSNRPVAQQTQSLVKLLADSTSGKTPYFIIPGGWNFAIFFQRMAQNLAEQRIGYGLTYPGLLPGGSRFETVEELAQQLIAHIRDVHPVGPYLLVGHSFGGVVGVEMARILESQKESVGLVLVDTKLRRLRRKKSRLARMVIRGRAALEPQRIVHHLKRLQDAARERLFPADRGAALARVADVKAATLEAIDRYHPSRCAFPAVLIRAGVPTRGDHYFVHNNTYGWSDRLNIVDVLVVPGNHYELHRSSEGRDLAIGVGASLDALERVLGATETDLETGSAFHE